MKKLAWIVGTLAFPLTTFAAFENLSGIITDFGSLVNTVIPILFAVALLVFFWGLVKYLFGAEHDKEKAKKTMLWGVIALFVMAAVWGLVAFLGEALGIGTNTGAPDVSNLIPR